MSKSKAQLVNTMNAVRNESDILRAALPIANENNLADFSAPIITTDAVQNEFLSILLNRIILTEVRSMVFNNPLSELKKGGTALGYMIQDLAVNPATGIAYDNVQNNQILTDVLPDVKQQIYKLTDKKVYPVTLNDDVISEAFTSWENLNLFLDTVINSLYSGANIYEYNAMKDAMTYFVNNDYMVYETVTKPTDKATGDALLAKLRKHFLLMQSPSTNYNKYSSLTGATGAALTTWSTAERIRLVVTAETLATTDVYSLAAAFNLDKADFLGRVIVVDKIDADGNILAIMFDEGFTQFRDRLDKMKIFENAATLKRNYYWHVWRGFDLSCLSSAIAFCQGAPLKSITLNKSTTSIVAGATETLTATLDPASGGFYDTSDIVWTSNMPNIATVAAGVVTGVAAGACKITATVGGKSASCSVTITSA